MRAPRNHSRPSVAPATEAAPNCRNRRRFIPVEQTSPGFQAFIVTSVKVAANLGHNARDVTNREPRRVDAARQQAIDNAGIVGRQRHIGRLPSFSRCVVFIHLFDNVV